MGQGRRGGRHGQLEATAGVPHVFVAMVGLLEEASLALDNGGRFLRTHLTLASH